MCFVVTGFHLAVTWISTFYQCCRCVLLSQCLVISVFRCHWFWPFLLSFARIGKQLAVWSTETSRNSWTWPTYTKLILSLKCSRFMKKTTCLLGFCRTRALMWPVAILFFHYNYLRHQWFSLADLFTIFWCFFTVKTVTNAWSHWLHCSHSLLITILGHQWFSLADLLKLIEIDWHARVRSPD